MPRTRRLAATLAPIVLLAAGARAQEEAPPKRTAAANLVETLRQLDADGDMAIEEEEVPESGRAAFRRLLRRGDANESGELEADELRGLLGRLRALGDPPASRGRFRGMDKDGDGKVSRDEFAGPPALFGRMDADGDGFLDRGEAARGFRAGAAAPLPGRLRGMDKDGDRTITREEFTGPEGAFDRLDANNDGAITEDELPRPGAGTATRGPAARRLMAMDRDGDGKVSREEFSGPARLFDRLDGDGDGAITAGEARRGAERPGSP